MWEDDLELKMKKKKLRNITSFYRAMLLVRVSSIQFGSTETFCQKKLSMKTCYSLKFFLFGIFWGTFFPRHTLENIHNNLADKDFI